MIYKLLVAEDVSAERTALCQTLKSHLGPSISIFEAADGAQALELFYREKPDIAILNIEMPCCSGLDVARKIRQSRIPCAILFISDFDNFSYARQAISLRALEYILKPYEEQKLILSVREAMDYISTWGTIQWDQPGSSYDSDQKDPESEDARLALVRQDINTFIEDHYMEELSMKNAAHAMNYSNAYFCKLFKQCFQVNFSTYLNEFRIQKARSMMENPRINIKDVGTACGYSDPNYFSRVFKRITGQTPTEYRLSLMDKNRKPTK